MTGISVTLPGGYWAEGTRYHEVEIRPLNGEDEVFLMNVIGVLHPPHITTALLRRCVEGQDDASSVIRDHMGYLNVGDREALLLQIRRLTYGERIGCIGECPECGDRFDLDLETGDLLQQPNPHQSVTHEISVREDGDRWDVAFRLPSGKDQEAVAHLSNSDPDAAEALLIRRCIGRLAMNQTEVDVEHHLPPVLIAAISQRMAELDPQAEQEITMVCPSCENQISKFFDTATFFFQEVQDNARQLLEEIHTLAYYYHWSEQDILAMTPRRRMHYLERLSDVIAQEGRA